MKVLFLTIGDNISEISSKGIYNDLMRKFRDEGHNVYIVTPIERRHRGKTSIREVDSVTILTIRTLNIQQTNIIEKGISTLMIEYQFLYAIKKYFSHIHFDLILYTTPPITFGRVIKYLKCKQDVISYLLLKDIFPQNAVDLGMMKKGSILHTYFKERRNNSIQDQTISDACPRQCRLY